MLTLPSSSWFRRQRDYLWWAVAISAALHAGVAWWWPTATSTPDQNASVDVALLNFSTESAPLQARLLAQWQADGGGEDTQGLRSSPVPATDMPTPDQLVLIALQKRQVQLEQQQQQLLHQLESEWDTRPHQQAVEEHNEHSQDQQEDWQLAQTPSTQHSLHALRSSIQRYNQQPRYIFEGPSAHQSPAASYIESWRAKIEALGTELYPEQARGRRSGTVQLTVYIRHDGSLEKIAIHQGAEDPLFTITAQRVVNLAAPFAPFPPELAKQGDVLAITRTWNFNQQLLITESP
ncbi:TonB family protein [Paenalcaligenes niemegkensis]|uniref:TonB family protein n=1 Tax=Paenalcaligenes niemegkensis TaxID=2895469 RepID=UPI001EE92839|nr:TonB family protein [Paenalcaligenes niemegkensis]MCQ9615466.1 TonB family protein [Paenalcaligenes niemegkensis]